MAWVESMSDRSVVLVSLMALGTALGACSAGAGGGSQGGDGGSPAQGGSAGFGGSGGFAGSAGGMSATGGDPGIFGQGGAAGSIAVATRDSCASSAFKGTLLPSSLLFLVDRSGSMACNLPPITASADCEANPVAKDPSQPTKWSVITGSLSAAFDTLATVPNTSAALTFFSNDEACGAQWEPWVALAPLDANQVGALKGSLSGITPKGGTPIIGATVHGYRYLHQEAKAPGNRFVVLVTDGADSCISRYAAQGVVGDPVAQFLGAEIPKAISVNIRTFVIGAPGSEPARGFLSQIAWGGGSGKDPACDHTSTDPAPGAECHLDMTRSTDFAADLAAALTKITGQAALTCEFDVPKAGDGGAIDPSTVNVDYYRAGNMGDRVQLYRDDTQACEGGADGWQYTSNDTKIRVCGPMCDAVRKDATAEVIVSLGCEQRIK